MKTSNPVLAALKIADPPTWRAKVRAALKAELSVPSAARVLGISRSTLYQWMTEDPALREGIELPPKRGSEAEK